MNTHLHPIVGRVITLIILTLFIAMSVSAYESEQPIVGGHEATPGEWPWQVALVRRSGDLFNDQFCGGSIISRDWVVTAAHCAAAYSQIDVVAGIHNLSDPDPNYRRVAVSQKIIHPGYNSSTSDKDIALLKLATPIDARAGGGATLPIAYIDLVPANVGALTGVNSTVTGWGTRDPDFGDYPDTLYELVVPIVSNASCNSDYGGGITANMLCAGFPQGGKDSCYGDSGGPLMINSGGWKLAGIVSWGNSCALPDYPGVYTRVSNFVDWIASETGGGGSGGVGFYVSADAPGSVDGVSFTPADILKFDPDNGWSMYFDGSDVGIDVNVAAIELQTDGSILMSLATAQTVGNLGQVMPQDILRFVPGAIGPNTTGSLQLKFDGSAHFLTTNGEKIDALAQNPDGRLAISTTGTAAVVRPGGGTLKAQDEDALGYNFTQERWSALFDGTPVTGLKAEDVNGLWIDPANGALYVTIDGAFNLGGTAGDGRDIIKLTPSGAPGGYTASLVFDGSAAGFPVSIDGLEMIP